MSTSVDQSSQQSGSTPRVLFVTDPLCSWCWGTLPEVLEAREQLHGEVQFDLIMGGLQVGTQEGLLGYDVKRLNRLWQEVEETTGQTFSKQIPDDFVYHSEVSCRAVEIARDLNDGNPPFEFFTRLQAAFYKDGLNINEPAVLADLLGQTESEVQAKLQEVEIIERTRNHFEQAKSLAATALPHFLIDSGSGYQLLCGGYVTAEFMIEDIRSRIR